MHSQKRHTEKNPNNNKLRTGRQTLAQRQTECDLSFGVSFVFTLAWPLSFINIKCQPSSTDSEDEEEWLPCVRESQSHKYRKTALSTLSGRTRILWSAVWVLVPALSNQPLRNVELPADIPYLFSPKTIHFGSFPAHISFYLYSPAQRKTVALRSCSYQEFSVILHFITFSQMFLLEFLRRNKNRDNWAIKSG